MAQSFKHRFFLLSLLLIIQCLVKATTIGSDTVVTRISGMTTLNNGDIVTGFTALEGGFFVSDPTTTATWNALFPVSGSMLLNAGQLFLQRDLPTGDVLVASLIGRIVGNGYTLDFAPTLTGFTNACVPVFTAAQTTAGFPLPISSLGLLVSWSYDDRFVTVRGNGAVNTANNIQNFLFDGTNLTLVGNVAGGSVGYTITWHPSVYFLAVGGGSTAFIYGANNAGALTIISQTNAANSVMSLAWHPQGTYMVGAITGNATTPIFRVTNTGNISIAATFTAINILGRVVAFTNSGNYFAIGFFSSSGSNNVGIYSFSNTPTPAASLQTSFLVGTVSSTQVGALAWHPIYQNLLAVGQSANATGDFVSLWRYDSVANTVTLVTSLGGFNATGISSLDWSNDGSCLLVGLNNAANPAANKMQTYSFNATTTELTLVAGNACTSVNIPGPDAVYSPVNNYIGQFAAPTSNTGQLRVYVPTNVMNVSNLTINLRNDLDFNSNCLLVNGNCSILGNGHTLELQSDITNLSIAANSTLTLRDVNITSFGLDTIQMQDDSSTLILDNVTIDLDNSATFTQGALKIEKDVIIKGQGSFVYSSTMPCTINRKSTLLFDNEVTFSFIPASNARNLLQFTDKTSHLFLNGATLVTTRTGIDLTKGTLVVDRHATIVNDATVTGEAIAFGDGVSVANNMNLQVYPAAGLEIAKGIVVDKNV